jgi:hypothetical protein
LVAGLLLMPGCADRTATEAAYEPQYAGAPHATASVVGVYRDGVMSEREWSAMAADVARATRSGRCDGAYGGVWAQTSPQFETELNEAVESLGVSDDWLDHVAPAARGDLVLVIAERSQGPEGTVEAPAAAAGQTQRSPELGKGKGALLMLPVLALALLVAQAVPDQGPPEPTLDMLGILYSRVARHTVAALHLHYVGASASEAHRMFAEKLAAEWPDLRCAGWAEQPPRIRVAGS